MKEKNNIKKLIPTLAKPGKHWQIANHAYQKTPLWDKGSVIPENEVHIPVPKKKSTRVASEAGLAIDVLLASFEVLHFDWIEIWVEEGKMLLSIDSEQLEEIYTIIPS